MTLQELLKAANITDEVINGLPKDVVAAVTGYVSEADTKLTSASAEAAKAEEVRRQTELDRAEINDYVTKYGTSLTDMAAKEAELQATRTYLASLKAQGFDVKIPGAEGTPPAKPIVPGSPAVGGNAVDENKILGKVGDVLSQFLDANNEHIRLFGTPIPDPSTNLGDEAARARKPIGQYIREKYNFAAKQKQIETAAFEKKVNDAATARVEDLRRKDAEGRGSNPALRQGESSRASLMPRSKPEDFHKADGFQSTRERRTRMLENLHKDVEAVRNSAA